MKTDFQQAVTTGIYYALNDDLEQQEDIDCLSEEQQEAFADFHGKLAELAKEYKALKMLGN